MVSNHAPPQTQSLNCSGAFLLPLPPGEGWDEGKSREFFRGFPSPQVSPAGRGSKWRWLAWGMFPWGMFLGLVVFTSATFAASTPAQGPLGDEPIRKFSTGAARPQDTVMPVKPGEMDYPRVLGALAAVIGLIFVMRWCGRWFFPSVTGRGSGRAVEVLSRCVLSPKQQVMLLRVGHRVIVVGDSGAQMNPLCEIADPDEVAALVGQLQEHKVAVASAFGSVFGRFRRGFDGAEESSVPQSAPLRDVPDDAPVVASAREELGGLRERVRLLSQQFNGASGQA